MTSRTTTSISKDQQKMLKITQVVHNQQSMYLDAGFPVAVVCMGRGVPCHGSLLSRLDFFQLRRQLGPCRTKDQCYISRILRLSGSFSSGLTSGLFC